MKKVICSASSLEDVLKNNIFLGSKEVEAVRQTCKVDSGKLSGEYETGIASDRELMCAIFKLRLASHIACGYVNPNYHFESSMEFDEYDKKAALFYVKNLATQQIHCAARLVFDQGCLLPMEEYYPLEKFKKQIGFKPDKTILVEFSRLISYPISQKELNRCIVQRVFEFATQKKASYILGCGRCDIKHYYDKWGFKNIQPYKEITLSKDCPIRSDTRLYAHYMTPAEIMWNAI